MNILIINVHSTLNLGDAAILEQTIAQVVREFPDAVVTVASNNPSECCYPQGAYAVVGSFKSWIYHVGRDGRIHYRLSRLPSAVAAALIAAISYRVAGRPVYTTRSLRRKQLLEAYVDADLVLNTGGHVLTTRRRGAFSYLVIVGSTLFAQLVGKPLYMYPQTIGPFATTIHRLLSEALLRNTGLVLIRDRELFDDSIRAAPVRHKAISVPDAAFGYGPGDVERGWSVLARAGVRPRDGVPDVGLTAIQWSGMHRGFRRQQQYEKALTALIRHVVLGIGGRVLLFGQSVGPSRFENDLLLARALQAAARLPSDRVVVVDGITTPHDLVDAYATLDFLVGTRMHSTILAMASSVPVLAIAYTMRKHRGLFRELALEGWVCDIETTDEDSLIAAFDRAWEGRLETSRHLQETIPTVRFRSRQVARMIRKDMQ
jgi:polysaccharide pyruvyl transferase WcaK-like protein